MQMYVSLSSSQFNTGLTTAIGSVAAVDMKPEDEKDVISQKTQFPNHLNFRHVRIFKLM